MNSQTGTRGFPTVVQRFFCDYLMNQRNVSPRTIAAYRDTFRLLLRKLQTQSGKSASELEFPDLDAPAVLAFLRSLEEDRGNSICTRNARSTRGDSCVCQLRCLRGNLVPRYRPTDPCDPNETF